jgi:hypothetical protein
MRSHSGGLFADTENFATDLAICWENRQRIRGASDRSLSRVVKSARVRIVACSKGACGLCQLNIIALMEVLATESRHQPVLPGSEC